MSDLTAVTTGAARALLAMRGETASSALAALVIQRYQSMSTADRVAFFGVLLDEFGAERDAVDEAIAAWQKDRSEPALASLAEASESRRLQLFRAINTAPGGIRMLLDMRADLLTVSRRDGAHPELAPVERDLRYLLESWFNRGFLRLERLDWTTPAHVLESLIRYEAVHEIRGWGDLRRRLAPDRRSFGFFHPALPDEPIIFVEVALTTGLAASIQDIIDAPPVMPSPENPDAPPAEADTAIFYSITNCQRGLRGISFGSFLIKRVTEHLSAAIPQLSMFSTLSPIPGFAEWLADNRSAIDPSDEASLTAACADYLLTERRGTWPLDPVARFHLRNGARVERLNPGGDTSPKGMGESHGMLVNYRYSGQDLTANHDALELDGVVTAARGVADLATVNPDVGRYRVTEDV